MRKDELRQRATIMTLKINEIQPEQWDATDQRDCTTIFEALQQVEREVLSRCQDKIESLMEKENESTDDQVWEYRDWLRAQQKELG